MVAFLAALLLAVSAEARALPTVGDLPVLVVLAEFPDRPLAQPRAHFTGTPQSLVDRLVAYVTEVSSGRLRLIPHVGGPVVTVPLPRARYVQRPASLASDALQAFAKAAHDPADVAALRAGGALVVFFAGSGRESHVEGGDPNDPWSNYVDLAPAVEGFERACVIAETEVPPFSPFGVLCHEFGHLLGLPELYAPGALPQEGIGVWGLMGQGTWLGRGDRPPHLDAWSKAKLGWVDVETIDRTTTRVHLPAVGTTPRVVKIPAVPGKPREYYLLENRSRTGADAKLPGEGILVWHVDEGISGFRNAQSVAAHKLLHLVEADRRGDLDRGHAAGGNRGDATDPWSGPPAWQRRVGAALAVLGALAVAAAVFRVARPWPIVGVLVRLVIAGVALVGAARLRQGPVCDPTTPGMAPYDDTPGRVVLRNFSPVGPDMYVDVLVAPADMALVPPTT